MEVYEKTVWENDETQLNEENMNKIEDQLENLTDEIISEESKNYATETYVDSAIEIAIGDALGGEY